MVLVQDCIAIPDTILENAAALIGQKASTRSVLQQLKLPTPKAFVVTSAAFYHFLSFQNGLNKWRAIIDNAQVLSPENMVAVSRQLQKLVRSHPIDPVLAKSISTQYHKVLGNSWAHLTISPTPATKSPVNIPLPVIKGEAALIDFLRQIWSAQLTPHSLSLQLISRQELFQLSPVMVSSHDTALVSGTIITIEPETRNKNAMLIQAIYGTNPETDQKHIPGDIYIVDRTTRSVISRRHQSQTTAVIADYFGHYKPKKIPPSQQFAPKLTSAQIDVLVDAASRIHHHQMSPQIINWLITKSGIHFTRFQKLEVKEHSARLKPIAQKTAANQHLSQVASGLVASPGIATAPVIRFSPKVQSVIAKIVIITDPDHTLLSKLRQAAGIIIESGGITSEISIVARDIGIPTLVGTGRLKLADGTVVTIDAIKGRVIIDRSAPKPTDMVKAAAASLPQASQIIATKLLLSLNQINPNYNYVYQQADGIGELRGNDLVMAMGIHPKRIIDRHLPAFKSDFIQKLTQASNLFGDRPVYYHPIDLPTNTARTLEHGSVYEPIHESNTHFGYRGSYRAISDQNVFKTEIALIAELRNKYALKNISLCLPLVRSISEFIHIKRLVTIAGLHRAPSFKLLVKIGTPAAVDYLPHIANEGVDGCIIDLDLLALSVLGYDPDSSEVDQEIKLTNPAVMAILQSIIKVADANRIPHAVTSYRLSQSPELISAVIEAGESSLIVHPPQFDQVRLWVAQSESRLVTSLKSRKSVT
jgi:pyruvate, water dikinase